MNLSAYFHDQVASYQAEIDDLASDSEGRDVLQRRLKDKRSGFASIVAMLDTDPLLLAPVFHGAFEFGADCPPGVAAVLATEFGDFPPWAVVCEQVRIASWAQPMVALALDEPLGEEFMALAVGLEYAFARHKGGAAAPGGGDAKDDGGLDRERGDGEGDEGEGEGTDALGEDFLEQQGFDRRTPT